MGLERARIIRLEGLQLSGLEAFFGKPGETRSQLAAALANARPSELIDYYSGHAMPVDGATDAVLLPLDGDPVDPAATGYRLSTFYANMRALGVQRLRFYIDAAFNNRPGAQPMPTAETVRPVVNYPKFDPLGITTPPQWIVVTASSGNEPALDGPGQPYSVFTGALVEGLRGRADAHPTGNSDGIVTSGELIAFLGDQVGQSVEIATGWVQTPRLNGSPHAALFRYRAPSEDPVLRPAAIQPLPRPVPKPAKPAKPVKLVAPSFDCAKARSAAEKRRAMLVNAQVSSMNTRRSGSF